MRNEFITAVQRAIVLYVIKNEGKRYKGDHSYNIKYIKDSKYIPDHRKRDIEKIDDMFKSEEEGLNSDIKLASEIYKFLKSIKTGFMLFWLIQISTSSSMRDAIHNAMFIHDPQLYEACKNGTTGAYSRNDEESQSEPSTTLSDDDDVDNDLIELYAQLKKDHNTLKKDNNNLKGQIQDLQTKLSKEEMKNAILDDSVNKLSFTNEALMKKLDKFLQKNGPLKGRELGIQMVVTPRSKTVNNIAHSEFESFPSQTHVHQAVP